jgi:hypothetical protein
VGSRLPREPCSVPWLDARSSPARSGHSLNAARPGFWTCEPRLSGGVPEHRSAQCPSRSRVTSSAPRARERSISASTPSAPRRLSATAQQRSQEGSPPGGRPPFRSNRSAERVSPGLTTHWMRQEVIFVRRYRTQGVAGASPASSTPALVRDSLDAGFARPSVTSAKTRRPLRRCSTSSSPRRTRPSG